MYVPISTRNASIIPCSLSISPSGVFVLDCGRAFIAAAVVVETLRESAVSDSRSDARRAVNFSLAAAGEGPGCIGNKVVCVNGVG